MGTDITDRKVAEAEREKFVTLVENSTDFIGICDIEGVPLYVNPAGLKMVGLDSLAQARHTHVREFFFPEDQPRIMDEFFPAVNQTGHGEIEIRFRHFGTQEAKWMAYKVLKLVDAGGQSVAFATVSQDVTERRRLRYDLRKLAADLSEIDRRKNEFLATLSHELRNPLAPLRNMLEILKRAAGSRERVSQTLDTMDRQLGQLVRLVDDLLDLSRITHDRIDLRKSRVELASVIDQALQACRPLAESAGHDINVVVPPEPLYVHADPVRLAQGFGNLLNNSCKYTPRGGKIMVTARRQGDDAVVTLEDTGIGIQPEKLGSIFDMFVQIDGSLERSQGGLGIGLTLVKRLVELHGGSIEATSAGEGRGSAFTVRLPIMIARPDAARHATAPSAHDPTHVRRILIVDDNKDAAASLAVLLQITGHKTFTAHDGHTALEAVAKDRPEVVLLDIGLPMLNGYEVCRRIREQPGGNDTIVIALTGWGQEDDRRRSHEAGFDGHLVKPVEYDALITLLDSMAAVRGAR